MKVLVIGSGGREHALCWKLSQSPRVEKVYCAPGNGGTAGVAENVPINAEDIYGLVDFSLKNKIGLAVVGPEVPLVKGVVDEFEKNGLKIFGPRKEAAMLEGSKAFAKGVMQAAGVPTAEFEVVSKDTGPADVAAVAKKFGSAAVKADGLCAGKGVIICNSPKEIVDAVDCLRRGFSAQAENIIVEELLEGEEASILAFCDGKAAKLMVSSQDHKRAFDNDKGPNTGGMGAYAPAPVTKGIDKKILDAVFMPVLAEMSRRGLPYKGVLYAGLMIEARPKKGGLANFKVLEFNVRFGDPETQAVLPLLESDIVEAMEACIDGNLGAIDLEWGKGASCCVVVASGGYPGKYENGKKIFGLGEAGEARGVTVFHAGTRMENGDVFTDGGRVLGVTGSGGSISAAIGSAYAGVAKIKFEGMHFRRDIGKKAT